jgi:hypothetical protein
MESGEGDVEEDRDFYCVGESESDEATVKIDVDLDQEGADSFDEVAMHPRRSCTPQISSNGAGRSLNYSSCWPVGCQ